jgi:hypothetical protein
MIRIERPDLATEPGRRWHVEAQAAMAEIIRNYHSGDAVSLDARLYQAAKPFLMELTCGKCAYCESLVTSTHPGDVEHYRPKGQVRERDGRIVRTRVGDQEVAHPGYWWLAYAWVNLLPACIDCNRRREHGEEMVPAGKADHFAIRGKRAMSPTDCLDDEQALLLDPSRPEFDASVNFEIHADGTIKPRTEEAAYTCELLGLNVRETLVGERVRAFEEAREKIAKFTSQGTHLPDSELRRLVDRINAMWRGHTPHGAFARAGLESELAAYGRIGINLKLPVDI